MKDKNIYLDYAATTPVDPIVLKEMLPYFEKEYGNPSSIHKMGQEGRRAIDKSREIIAKFLNCSNSEIVFTGSATEADNLAILGTVRNILKKTPKVHIITTQIEHHAVLEPFKVLEKEEVEVTYLPVDKEGIVKVSDVEKAIRENTVFISIMYANNEIGTIQPIDDIGKLLAEKEQKIIFHTDASQAINYLDCNVKKLGVDLLTISGHKIYGPKGIGALFIKQGVLVSPLIYGGGHEGGLKPGTENVAGIVGLGIAIHEVENHRKDIEKLLGLRDELIEGILENISGSELNGSREKRLPNNINVILPGVEGESIVLSLDQEGISASTGSACSSKGLKSSHVILALGSSQEKADSSLRLSLGRYTKEEEINKVLKALSEAVKRLRTISGYAS